MASMTLAELESMVRGLVFENSSDNGLFTAAVLDTYIQIAHRELWGHVAHVSPSTLATKSADKSITSSGLSFTGDADGGYIYYAPVQLDSAATGRIRLKVLSTLTTRHILQFGAYRATGSSLVYTPVWEDGALADDGVSIETNPGSTDISSYISESAASVYIESLDAYGSYPLNDSGAETPRWHFDTGGQTDMGGVNAIVKVEIKDSTGNYTLVDPMDTTEIGDSDSSTALVAQNNTSYRWYAMGETIYLHPAPSGTETIRVTYIPNPSDIATGTSPLGGKLINHHHLIAFRAADIACTKDDSPSRFHSTYLDMRKDLTDQIRRRHVTTSRRVRMSPWED